MNKEKIYNFLKRELKNLGVIKNEKNNQLKNLNIIKDDRLDSLKLINFHYPTYFGPSAGKMQTAPILKFQFVPYAVDAKTGGGLMGYTGGISFKPNIDAGFIFDSNGKMLPAPSQLLNRVSLH